MKATGIVRKLDSLNRIVVPKELCRMYDIEPGTPLEIFTDDNQCIVFRKYIPACIFCNETNNTIRINGKLICSKCLEKIKNT